jgi:hypothetical protein
MRHGFLSTAAILSTSTVILLGSSGASADPRTRTTNAVVEETGKHPVVLGLIGLADAKESDDRGDVDKELGDLEADWAKAVETNDPDRIGRFLTDDFLSTVRQSARRSWIPCVSLGLPPKSRDFTMAWSLAGCLTIGLRIPISPSGNSTSSTAIVLPAVV